MLAIFFNKWNLWVDDGHKSIMQQLSLSWKTFYPAGFLSPLSSFKAACSFYWSEEAPPKAEIQVDGWVCLVNMILKYLLTRNLISYFIGLKDRQMAVCQSCVVVLIAQYFTEGFFMFLCHPIKIHYLFIYSKIKIK